MYKKASVYLNSKSHLMEPYKEPVIENFEYDEMLSQKSYEEIPSTVLPKEEKEEKRAEENKGLNEIENSSKNALKMNWYEKRINSISDPRVWGPAFWFSLHSSSIHYPHNPSPIVRKRTKDRILAIPYEIPCAGCRPHASAFIEIHKGRLDDIVSSNKKLFNFYVDFHNKVNQRYGKKVYSYEEARKMYSGGAIVTYLKY